MNFWRTLFAKFLIIVTAIAIFIVLVLCLRPLPEPPPRNVKILICEDSSIFSTGVRTLLVLDGNSLEVIRYTTVFSIDEETGETRMPSNPLDMALLDSFFENYSSCVLHATGVPYHILDSGSVVLSQEQLEDVWRMIDRVVRNYEEPQLIGMLYPRTRAVIDGNVYWSIFYNYRPRNNRFPREYRHCPHVDVNLLSLSHYLIDLSPIPTRWD